MTASSSNPQGYKCQILGNVPEDYICQQCSLLARRLIFTSCCGESYCNACIVLLQQAIEPCPGCGERKFDVYPQVKYQKKILSLQANCPLKDKGCGWCGKVEELDAHLHGDCEYANVQCPLECSEKIARKDITHHTASECVKREYICPYCSYKAIYEIVANIHWPKCSYYPLPCPNRCGVTCERPTMEDHIKICPLQEVECVFQHVGCEAKFRREEEEEHMREKSQKHLTMMVSASFKTNQDLQKRLEKQEEMLKEQESRLEQQFEMLQAQDKQLKNSEKDWMIKRKKAVEELEVRLHEQKESYKGKLENSIQALQEDLQNQKVFFESKLQEAQQEFETMFHLQNEAIEQRFQELEGAVKVLKKGTAEIQSKIIGLEEHHRSHLTFKLEDFSEEKAKNTYNEWKSPVFCTHIGGYKFCIGIDANGFLSTKGNSVNCDLWAVSGETDDWLKWPVTVEVTLHLINHYPNSDNKTAKTAATWEKPDKKYVYTKRRFNTGTIDYCFVKHSELSYDVAARTKYLKDDTLYFSLSDITVSYNG